MNYTQAIQEAVKKEKIRRDNWALISWKTLCTDCGKIELKKKQISEAEDDN